MKKYQNFINGKWVDAKSGKDIREPEPGKLG